MYLILKRSSEASENVWSFHTVGGILFATEDKTVALNTMQELVTTTAFDDLRLIWQLETAMEITAAPDVPQTEPPIEP